MPTTLKHPSRVLLLALALGLCFEHLFYGHWVGISALLFVALLLGVLGLLSASEGRPPLRANLWLGGAAIAVALLLAWRSAAPLAALNLLALFGLLLLLAAHYRAPSLLRLPGGRVLLNLLETALHSSWRPGVLAYASVRELPLEPQRARRLLPIVRGLALALPVVACFGGLLVSADSVFASYVRDALSFQLPWSLAELTARGIVVVFVAWAVAGGLLAALLPELPATNELPAEGDTQRLQPLAGTRLLGAVEALTVLVALNLLFGGFMLVQGAYFFGGFDTLQRTGMTYAEYARRGFFELVAVASLALALVWGLALVTRREAAWQQLAFKLAGGLVALLVLGLLASAFQRMLLYEWAYGFTRLRLYTQGFMLWLALALVLFLLALLRDKPRWFSLGAPAAALLVLLALNVANPDALIVRENLARARAGGELDTIYLTQLSADATPELIAALPTLNPPDQAFITAGLGWQRSQLEEEQASGWQSWNLSRIQAYGLLVRANIEADPNSWYDLN